MPEAPAQACPRCGALFPPEQAGPCPVCRDEAAALAAGAAGVAPAAGSSSGPGEDPVADALSREDGPAGR
ncbi:hypothetical protein [Vallicoccus soli]|uniref:Uncharacterized protein n=1 Tax=Vallicoccus soli TaxID=2339232 RepID=A0A3A3YX21_9ACTN|nr:hypothetical protein [Vallicoccus soli]RJK94818.1 hypothetical protein D5H78_13465 [Vallicoccus soli]